jgi:hypothetical protein
MPSTDSEVEEIYGSNITSILGRGNVLAIQELSATQIVQR